MFCSEFCALQVGASKGLTAIHPFVSKWEPVFKSVPGPALLPFLQSLLNPPSGSKEVASLFAAQIIHVVFRLWLKKEAGQEAADQSLLLLADLSTQTLPKVYSRSD